MHKITSIFPAYPSTIYIILLQGRIKMAYVEQYLHNTLERGVLAMSREEIGRVRHYYSKISVAIIELSAPVNVGERITIVGPKTEFTQEIGSMQVEHKNITSAQPGDLIGLKVIDKVREGDRVFRLVD